MQSKFQIRLAAFVLIVSLVVIISVHFLVSLEQIVSFTIFSSAILGTVLFWNFRLSIAFTGISLLVITKTIDTEHLISFASLDIILFLVSMMVIMGLLREVNFFSWLIGKLLSVRNLTAIKLYILIIICSAFFASIVDEVTSIIFMVVLILELSNFFEIRPVPLIIASVMATNLGSSGTVLGNPIGILIATRAGLTFEDFLLWAFPLTVLIVIVATVILLFIHRKELKLIEQKLVDYRENMADFQKLLNIPPTFEIKKEILIFSFTLILIALHHRLETLFNFPTNELLFAIPMFSAGAIMFWRRGSARKYIEEDVDWWTLIFFVLLFAMAGTLKFTGITDLVANALHKIVGKSNFLMLSIISWMSFFGSSVVDNVVWVSAFIPVIHSFKGSAIATFPLWWALLFGGCLGGNLTMVGSTANIVAIGLLERRHSSSISFWEWLKIGLVVSLFSMAVAWMVIAGLSKFMPFQV